jgi:hypothetical protein
VLVTHLVAKIDAASMKGLAVYLLGYIGAISLAVIVAKAVPERFTAAIGNDLLE